jgi:acyl-CoA thioesterase
MTSTHPDFADVAGAALTDADMLRHFNDHRVEPTRLLNGRFLSVDSARGLCRCSFEIVPAFCHSQGRIAQGGFLTGMIDIAMAHAAIARERLACAVPTLELKISFLEPVGPGTVVAEGRVLRWGGSVGFLEGELRDQAGRLIVHATCTVKIVRPKGARPLPPAP